MTITVAMALSGLEPEQWNDGLKEIYMQGAILFPKSPSTLSLTSSSASSYYSIESGISSMSPDSVSYLNQFTANDTLGLPLHDITTLENIKTKAKRTIPDMSNSVGRKLMIDPESIGKQMAERLIGDLGDGGEGVRIVAEEEEEEEEVVVEGGGGSPPGKVYTQVMYAGRNVLNLFGNIVGGWQYQASRLPDGITSDYFANRSQYSRLRDAYPPKCTTKACNDKDCAFIETIYF